MKKHLTIGTLFLTSTGAVSALVVTQIKQPDTKDETQLNILKANGDEPSATIAGPEPTPEASATTALEQKKLDARRQIRRDFREIINSCSPKKTIRTIKKGFSDIYTRFTAALPNITSIIDFDTLFQNTLKALLEKKKQYDEAKEKSLAIKNFLAKIEDVDATMLQDRFRVGTLKIGDRFYRHDGSVLQRIPHYRQEPNTTNWVVKSGYKTRRDAPWDLTYWIRVTDGDITEKKEYKVNWGVNPFYMTKDVHLVMLRGAANRITSVLLPIIIVPNAESRGPQYLRIYNKYLDFQRRVTLTIANARTAEQIYNLLDKVDIWREMMSYALQMLPDDEDFVPTLRTAEE